MRRPAKYYCGREIILSSNRTKLWILTSGWVTMTTSGPAMRGGIVVIISTITVAWCRCFFDFRWLVLIQHKKLQSTI